MHIVDETLCVLFLCCMFQQVDSGGYVLLQFGLFLCISEVQSMTSMLRGCFGASFLFFGSRAAVLE